jgi:hypothetical protein
MGFATYGRQAVGLSSHAVIAAPPGQFICVTNVEVLPWLNLINSGTISAEGISAGSDTAPLTAAGDLLIQSARADWQLRIIADQGPDLNYNARAKINFSVYGNPGFLLAERAASWTRTFEVEKQTFDTLIYAKSKVQFSFSILDKLIHSALLVSVVQTANINSVYQSDIGEIRGINNEPLSINLIQSIIDNLTDTQIQNYFPFTQNLTTFSSVDAPNNTNFLIYPMGMKTIAGVNVPSNPIYSGETSQTYDLTNLPILNVEYVTFKAGNSTERGFFDKELLQALKW